MSQPPAELPPSVPSWIEENGVLPAMAEAITWSIETPFMMLAPSVLKGCMAVRKAAVPEAWSPPPSGWAGRLARPVSTDTLPATGASAASVGDRGYFAPAAAGVHRAMLMPHGR